MTATAMTMGGLADMLARQIGKPVIDQTGISGTMTSTWNSSPKKAWE